MKDDDQINKAFEHIKGELMIPQIIESLKTNFGLAQSSHDSIHEFILLTGMLISRNSNYSFKQNMVFFLHCEEIFFLAHRSSLDALSAHYNAAFINLRSVLELLIQGTFLDCLAHKKYRINHLVWSKHQRNKKIKKFLDDQIEKRLQLEEKLEKDSISIIDELQDFIPIQNNMPTFSFMLGRLLHWDLLQGIENPFSLIRKLYSKLSSEVHVYPDNTDVGRLLLSNEEYKPFTDKKILQNHLDEYLQMLRIIMDVGLIVVINMLASNMDDHDVREQIKQRIATKQFQELGLDFSKNHLSHLLKTYSSKEKM